MTGSEQHRPTADDRHRIVIYQSADREGSTFSLSRESRRELEKRFGGSMHPTPRIFVAHTTGEDFKRLHGSLWRQIVLLLTGLQEERLPEVGKVEFRDPVTEQPL